MSAVVPPVLMRTPPDPNEVRPIPTAGGILQSARDRVMADLAALGPEKTIAFAAGLDYQGGEVGARLALIIRPPGKDWSFSGFLAHETAAGFVAGAQVVASF